MTPGFKRTDMFFELFKNTSSVVAACAVENPFSAGGRWILDLLSSDIKFFRPMQDGGTFF